MFVYPMEAGVDARGHAFMHRQTGDQEGDLHHNLQKDSSIVASHTKGILYNLCLGVYPLCEERVSPFYKESEFAGGDSLIVVSPEVQRILAGRRG